MFDFGFSEILVIGVVALVVFGPEELPRVARLAGHMLGKFRRYVDGVKSELSQEMEMAELKRLREDVKESALSLQNTVNEHLNAAESGLRDTVAEVHQGVQQVKAEVAATINPQVEPSVELPVHTEPPPVSIVTQNQEPAPASFEQAPQEPEVGLPIDNPPPEPDENQLDLFGMPVSNQSSRKVDVHE
jgi:sec-independent protein translocase protein TatB